MICPNCKRNNVGNSNFCKHCGAEFLPGTQPADPFDSTNNGTNQPIKNNSITINKTLLSIIIAVATVIIAGLLIFVITSMQKNPPEFFNKESITDAEGEKIKEGIGTTEMSVMDVDGTVRTIKTDRSLLTSDKILSEYTAVMNQLKTDAPAFSFIRYQNLPTNYQNVGPAATIVLPIIEKYVTSKSASAPIYYTSGNADKLPLPNSAYGCLLTDNTKIKNAYCEIIDGNVYKIVITLVDEVNPQINPAGATTSPSAITAMFDPYDAATQITAISELAFNKIDFNYTDCTVTLIYDSHSKHVQSVNMTMNIDITANTLLGKLNARIVDICEYTQITY